MLVNFQIDQCNSTKGGKLYNVMAKYIFKRILSMIVTLYIIITITFVLMHSVPGGPFTDEDKGLPPAVEEALMEKYHLNDPLWKQYTDFLKGVIKFDLGPSYAYEGRTVTELITMGFPITARLALLSLILIIFLGIPLGVTAALKQNTWVDKLIMVLATLGRTIPSFVKATLLLFVFAYTLEWFPIFGVDSLRSYVLPAVALSLSSVAYITRLNRSSMLEALGQDYIRTARAKGVNQRNVIYKHALKNASIPTVTVLGTRFATLLTGSFVVEKIFALPGIGRYFVQSVGNRDYPTIMGVTIFFSVILLVMMLIVDISYGFLDPRVRIHKKR